MKKITIHTIATLLLFSCSNKTASPGVPQAEVLKAENDFKKLSQSKGIQEAFYAFAADNAVIKRENDILIKGRENIKNYYNNPKFKKVSVSWKPDIVEVSEDGTLGYTYGRYVWTVTDSVGAKKDFKGIFHTVWKKQKDGSWKYVWD
jgi:ketosteroid isomerase-like protein